LNAGDEVIIESPCYEPIRCAAEKTKAKVIFWHRKSEGFSLDTETLSHLITANTKLLILSNLHNPTSVGTTRNDLIQVADIAQKNGPKIVVDEIHLDFAKDTSDNAATLPIFAKGKMIPAMQLENELFISISSLSKVYNLSRIRTGWILAASEVVTRLRETYKLVVNIGCHDTEAVSSILFENLDNYAKRSQDIVKTNREIMQVELGSLIDDHILSGEFPKYGCTYFPKLPWLDDLEDNADKIIDMLDTHCGVAPGGYFGEDYRNYIRIGFGGPEDRFHAAIRKLKQKLETLYSQKYS
jgi:aspartate/methionine/tyrosine aminotransferase